MKTESFVIDTIEGYASLFDGATETTEFLQLTKGNLSLSATFVDLGGITLEWYDFGAGCRIRDAQLNDSLVLGLVVNSCETVWFRGVQVESETLFCWQQGQETEYLARPGTATLGIVIEREMRESLNLPDKVPEWIGISANQRRSLLSLARQAQRAAARSERSLAENAKLRLAMALQGCLDQGNAANELNSASTNWMLMKRAESLLHATPPDRDLSADVLAHELKVPRRTLFHAFKRTLGVGPLRFQRIARMHQLRAQLLAAHPNDASVTQLAFKMGFRHLGRLSAEYRSYFGESPRVTLASASPAAKSPAL